MKVIKATLLSGALLFSASNSAVAGVCDWRPSQFAGTAATAVAGTTVAATGIGMKAAGFYTLVHAGSGLTMLGSTLAGASGAGTVGIIAGTGGVIGAVGAVLLAPVTAVVGGGAAAGAAGMEVACYFTDERVTEYDDVLRVMEYLSKNHDPDRFRLVTGIPARQDDAIRIWNPETEQLDRYLVSDLYFVNGRLWVNRPWRFDRDLGTLVFVQPADD